MRGAAPQWDQGLASCAAAVGVPVQPPTAVRVRRLCCTAIRLLCQCPAAIADEGSEEEEDDADGGAEAGRQDSSDKDGGAAAPSALEAFLDASADTLAGGASSAPAVRRGSASGGAAVDAVTATFERYGLADTLAAPGQGPGAAQEEDDGEPAGSEGGGDGAGRRHLSAKERQLLKKQQQGKAGPPQGQQQPAGGSGGGGGKKGQQQAGKGGGGGGAHAAAASQATPKGRGAGKGKKGRQDKYADQDEEDRQLAAALLQSAGKSAPELAGAGRSLCSLQEGGKGRPGRHGSAVPGACLPATKPA